MAIQLMLLTIVLAAGPLGRVDAGSLAGALEAPGAAAMLAGAVLALRGIVDLRGALTPLPHPRAGAELVDTGSYALVRHPIYGGIVIAAVGYAVGLASPPALVGALVLLLFFRLKSGREELWLRERYPSYADYAARTRRLVPFVY